MDSWGRNSVYIDIFIYICWCGTKRSMYEKTEGSVLKWFGHMEKTSEEST